MADAFYEAAKAAVIGILSFTDEQVRAEKLRRYILDSKSRKQIGNNFKALAAKDTQAEQICEKLKYQAPCNPANKPVTFLDGLQIYEKWTLLRQPWHMWRSWYLWRREHPELSPSTKASSGATSVKLQATRVEDFKRMLAIEEALAPYNAVRLLPAPRDITAGMQRAHEQLINVAEGKTLTPEQALAIFRDLADRLGKVRQATENATKKYKEMLDAASKL